MGRWSEGVTRSGGGEGDPDLSRDIPRGAVIHGDPCWSTAGVRSKEWHREVAAH